MKIKERALAILLSMVMVLTFMPALAFAEGEDGADADAAPSVEETTDVINEDVEGPAEEVTDQEALTEATSNTNTTPAARNAGEDWWIAVSEEEWLNPWAESVAIEGEVVFESDDPIDLEYRWLKGDTEIKGWTGIEYDEDYEYYYGYISASEPGDYTFSVREKNNNSEESSAIIHVYPMPVQGGLYFFPVYDDEGNFVAAGVEETDTDALRGHVDVPSMVSFPNGETKAVTVSRIYAPYASSISIPASVTFIYEDLGFDNDDKLIPGFVIFGTSGTAAQAHANKYGIIFRDLAAEAAAAAAAAREGTYDPSLPKVKASKPKASKKAFTAKWKKLKKKQLKSGATNIEVWACADGAFAAGSTIERVVGKKKASTKIKGVAKGTYFVKVRAIKYVGGVKYVGPWSAVKKVKVKK